MSRENERNYFNQTLKVLSWLKNFRDANNDHSRFTFQFSRHNGKLFQGRGKEDNPKNKIYIEVARRDGRRAYCCLEFKLSNDFTAIESACFRIGWKAPNGRIKEEFENLARELNFTTQGKDSGTVAKCERQGEEEVRNWLNTWLRDNYSTIVRVLSNTIPTVDDFNNSLESKIRELTEAGIIVTENGEHRLSDTAFANANANNIQGDDDEDDFDPPISDIVKELVLSNLQVIITGAPGTGKTYTARKVAEELACEGIESEDERIVAKRDRVKSVQFHPGYDYSDFVIGMKPRLVGAEGNQQVAFEWESGVFKKFADEAKENLDHKYVFLIDEINRADLSRVFGEMFSLLEEDYRYYRDGNEERNATGIVLPNGENFVIPNNLYIIGTMNDIDRSVESMDFALRRRFAWKEINADESSCIIDAKINDEDAVQRLKNAMTRINEKIAEPNFRLGTEYQLGGAIFAKYMKYVDDPDAFWRLWENHIRTILNEYLRGRRDKEGKLEELQRVYNSAVQAQLPDHPVE